jgi:hypothetical protein
MLQNRRTGFGAATIAAAARGAHTCAPHALRRNPVSTATRSKSAAPKRGARANKTAITSAVAALNAGNAEDYLALFRPDAALHGFPAGIEDVDGLCRFHAATTETYPDASVTLDDVLAENNRVATRFTWRASQGPGVELVAHGGAIVRFHDGQIAECWNLPGEVHAVTP